MIRFDWGQSGSFAEFNSLHLSGLLFPRMLIKALIPFIVWLRGQQAIILPDLDRLFADIKEICHFVESQHASFPQPIGASLQPVVAYDTSNDGHTEGSSFAGPISALVENRGNLVIVVPIEESVDFLYDIAAC